MTKPKAEIGIEPVMLNEQETAALLGLSINAFQGKRPALQKQGFPKPDPLLRRYYRRAILAWLDGRAGLAAISRDATEHAEREKEQPL